MADSLGERIRFLRTRERLTLEDLGSKVGVTLGVVNHWEKGRTQVPSELVPKLAAALGVSISGLYGVESPTDAEMASAGLLALSTEDRAALTQEDWRSIRDFIEYVLAKRKAAQRGAA